MSAPGDAGRTALPAYLATATLARSASEAAGPALLVVGIAVLGSATTGSYLVAAMTAAAAVGGPVVGALLDRTDHPRRGFTVSMVTMAGGIAAVALTIGHLPLLVVAAFAAIAGFGYPAITGAWSAQLPILLPAERLTRGYSADAATYSVAAVVAPPVAAALVGWSITAPLWLPVLLMAIAIVALRTVPIRARESRAAQRSLTDDLRSGFSLMARNRPLRRTVVLTTVGFAGQAAIFVTAPVLATELTGSLEFTGVILGVFAAGGVITALWFTRHPVARPDRAIIAATALSAVALAVVGLAPATWLLLVAAFVMGAAEPPMISSMFRVRARESPPGVQAQVFTTAASLRTAAFAFGTATCGALLVWGVGAVIVWGVLLHVVSIAIGLAIGPPLPRRDDWLHRA